MLYDDLLALCNDDAWHLLLDTQITRRLHQKGVENVSPNTVADWRNYCREVHTVVLEEDSEQIGGEGKSVEIEESKFGNLILLLLYFILYSGDLIMIKCIKFHNVLELIDVHNALVQIRLESFSIHKDRNI